MFDSNTVYICGTSKSQMNNPITYQYGRFFLGVLIDKGSGKIIACSASTALQLTNQFLETIFCGKNIITDGKIIQEEIENRYIGASQKALLVAYRDVQKRFQMLQKGDLKGAVTDFNLN